MIRKHSLYQIAAVGWGVLVFGFVILTISGNARPFLSPDALPVDGPIQMVGVAVALTALGVFVIQHLETRAWKAAGKHAGLSPQGGGIFSNPDLVGAVEGREVRAWIESRQVGGGEGSNTAKYTVVTTDLAEPTQRGLIVTPGGPPTAGMEDLPVDIADQLTAVGDVTVLGESKEFARAAVTSRVQDALTETDALESVHVGESADVFLDAINASGSGLAASMVGVIENKIKDRMPGGPETVGTDRKGVILDGTELDARARAVAAVADGFENASERGQEPGAPD